MSVMTADVQAGTTLYPVSVAAGDCPTGPTLTQSLAAEIWSYDPATQQWARVFVSPTDLFIGNDINGQPSYTARDTGFRGMTVFTEPDGTQALYVGGVTSGSIYEKLPVFNGSAYPPPRLLRSTDGTNWAPVPQNPGTFMGNIGLPQPGSTRYLRTFRASDGLQGDALRDGRRLPRCRHGRRFSQPGGG